MVMESPTNINNKSLNHDTIITSQNNDKNIYNKKYCLTKRSRKTILFQGYVREIQVRDCKTSRRMKKTMAKKNCALLNMEEGKTFKPHRHIWKERTRYVIAQESWVVIQGKVRCTFFDIDDSIISEPILIFCLIRFSLRYFFEIFLLKAN